MQLLAQTLMQPEEPTLVLDPASDPLLRLAGWIESDIPDLADNHDYYIGQTLYDEMDRDEQEQRKFRSLKTYQPIKVAVFFVGFYEGRHVLGG